MVPKRSASDTLVKVILLLPTLLALTFTANAATRPAGPIEAELGAQPNHLEPISPEGSEYRELLERRLLVVGGSYGTFLYCPSFQGEMLVAVYETLVVPVEARSFKITITHAAKNL